MREFILSVAAAGALGLCGSASAQNLDTIVGSVLADALTTHNQPYPYNSTYIDQQGRRVYVDQYGRHVIQRNQGVDNRWGNPYDNGYYDRRKPRNAAEWAAYMNRYPDPAADTDGDGVRNDQDRRPNDRRYR